MRHHLTLLIVVLALLGQACGDGDTSAAGAGGATEAATGGTDAATTEPTDAATTEPTEQSTTGGGSTVAVEDSDLGPILVDGEGRTLYLFESDEQSDSTCYDDCEENWPPLEGPAEAGADADDALLGVVERDDGTQQVTYNNWPLYYFAGDQQAGDLNGQGVGEVWFAVTPAGEPAEEGGGDGETTDY